MIGNFVQETANAPGSAATVTLAGASPGRRGIIAAFGGGATVYLGMDDGTQWQLVEALTVAGPPQQITITNVLNNSAGNTNRLNFTGSVRIYSAIPAERNVYQTTGGAVVVAGEVVSTVGALTTRAAGNRHLYFSDSAGAEAALVWHEPATNTLNMRLAGQSPAISVQPSGATNFSNAIATSAGDITAQAGSLRSQINGAPTTGQVVLGNGTARLYYDGTLFDLNAHLASAQFRGGPSDAGTLRTHGTANSVNFRWDNNLLLYRVDEALERAIMVAPTGSAGVSQWQTIGNTLPSGGTWAWFVVGFASGGGALTHGAGVGAGGSTVLTGAANYAGFAWRIA